jgi:hypothetical protein
LSFTMIDHMLRLASAVTKRPLEQRIMSQFSIV